MRSSGGADPRPGPPQAAAGIMPTSPGHDEVRQHLAGFGERLDRRGEEGRVEIRCDVRPASRHPDPWTSGRRLSSCHLRPSDHRVDQVHAGTEVRRRVGDRRTHDEASGGADVELGWEDHATFGPDEFSSRRAEQGTDCEGERGNEPRQGLFMDGRVGRHEAQHRWIGRHRHLAIHRQRDIHRQ